MEQLFFDLNLFSHLLQFLGNKQQEKLWCNFSEKNRVEKRYIGIFFIAAGFEKNCIQL